MSAAIFDLSSPFDSAKKLSIASDASHSRTWVECSRFSAMSSGLFGLIEQIRTEQLKHHQARFRYPVGAPLRHGPVRYFKDLSHCASATK